MNHNNAIRNSKHQQQQRNDRTFNMSTANFPNLGRSSETAAFFQPTGPSFADQLKRSSNPTTNDELYSMDDLYEIFQAAVTDLMECTNKGQQVQVLFKILSNAFK